MKIKKLELRHDADLPEDFDTKKILHTTSYFEEVFNLHTLVIWYIGE